MVEIKKGCLKKLESNSMTNLLSLKHTGTIVEYHDQFVFLLEKVELFEGYATSLFLNGLKKEIQPSIRLFKPKTIQQTFVLAHLQECIFKTLHQKSNTTLQEPTTIFQEPSLQHTPTNTFLIKQKTTQTNPDSFKRNNKSLNSTKIRSNSDFDEKKIKGFCLWCDDEYIPDHKGNKNKLLVMVVSKVKETVELEKENSPKKVFAISERAVNEYKIMEVVVYAKRFHFLIDFDDGNNMAYMAMLKKMRLERLTAGYRQHNSKISYSQVSNSQPRGQGLF